MSASSMQLLMPSSSSQGAIRDDWLLLVPLTMHVSEMLCFQGAHGISRPIVALTMSLGAGSRNGSATKGAMASSLSHLTKDFRTSGIS